MATCVCFCCRTGLGDVEPMAGLALASRALGAEVRVCVAPDEEFAESLAGIQCGGGAVRSVGARS